MNNWYHLPNSAHVFVRSCVSVFAVTTPRVSALVLMAHRMAQDTSASSDAVAGGHVFPR